MAQLLKLQDYVSRYESDLSRYPSQYVRLKTQQWKKLKGNWEQGIVPEPEGDSIDDKDEDNQGLMTKFKGFFKKEDILIEKVEKVELGKENDETQMVLSLHLPMQAQTELELKQLFLDQLLRFQINWASSTIAEKSFVDQSYHYDERLRYLLQRFPDTFLLLYQPIFLLKKAPVELEVLLLTPTEIWCIVFLEEEEDAAFVGSMDHFWVKRIGNSEHKILNPALSAGRMEKIVKQLFKLYEVDLPLRKAVLSRNGYIDYPDAPGELQLLDKRVYEDWFQMMRANSSPLKMMQMRAAKALLDYCQTTSFRRTDWGQRYEQGRSI